MKLKRACARKFGVSGSEGSKRSVFDGVFKVKSGTIRYYLCSTRKEVERLYHLLKHQQFSVGKYHGGLNDAERMQNQEDFYLTALK